jgi:predicted phage-related endonuclease
MPLLAFDEKLKRREEIAELMDKLSVEKKQIEQEIKVYMKDSEIAENEHFLVSWKNSISNRLDSARLKSEMPEIYEKFLKPIQSRRFIVREV